MLYKKYAFLEDILTAAIDFNQIDEDFCYEHLTEYLDDEALYAEGWNYDNGASKLVLFNNNYNFVVKIPFNSYISGWNGDFEYVSQFLSAIYPISGGYGWDYCKSEAEYFKLAEQYHVDFFFAPTRYIGSIAGYPIYIQEKIDIYNDNSPYHEHTIDERSKSAKRASDMGIKNYNIFGCDYLVDLFNYYTPNEIRMLFNFINRNDIGDLRTENVGYELVTGAPLICDYSDFRD